MVDAAQILDDTRVERLGEAEGVARYGATAEPAWSFFMPSGGVLTAIALRAAWAEAGEEWRPLSSTTLFHEAVPEGPLEVRVHVLRRGNVTVQTRAELGLAGGPPRMEVLTTFVKARSGPSLVARSYPDELAGPREAEPYWRSSPDLPFFRQLEARLAHGRRFWEGGWEPGPARCARWFRYRRAPHREGRLALEALPPLVDTMPAAVFEALGSEHPRLFAPSLDLTVHYLADTAREWILCQARAVWAEDGYASAEIELWDEDRRLLAYGTQTMMLRRFRPRGGSD